MSKFEDTAVSKEIEGDVAIVIDPAEEKRVLAKLDRVILPLMAFVYFFQYLDKQSINYAAVFGLSKNLHLTGSEFSWTISIFYFGQLVSEYPAAYLMSRMHLSLFVGICIVLWGGCEMCLAATQDFAGIGAVRFLLGFTEGAVAPSFMIITSNWYCRREHPVRIASWVSMFGVSQVVGALMMYGIGQGQFAVQTWRVMFLICGALTVVCGIVFILLMPRDPSTAWFLTENERKIAIDRLLLDRATGDRTNFDMRQAIEAVSDPRTLAYAAMALFITIPTAIVKFSSLVISGFGYSPFQTMLVGLPSGGLSFIMVWTGALIPLYFPNSRCVAGILLAAVPMLGSLLLLLLPASASWGIVVSTWLAASSAAPLGMAVGLMSSNVRGNTKKSVVGAIFFVMYCVGCITSPQLWQQQDAPRYRKGCIASVVSWGCLIVMFTITFFTSQWSNAKRNKEAETDAASGQLPATASVEADCTEKEDRTFRYSY